MKTERIRGIIPPMVTPFLPDESLDIETLKREVDRLLSAGVDGLSFGGSTGEGALLHDEELERGVRAIRAEAGSDVPILCGIIRNSTHDGISAAQAARAGGADCLMVTPTYYHGTDDAGNVAYYDAVYKASKMPIVIYNVIKTNPILPSLIPALCENPGLIGVKQAVGGVHAVADMVMACKGRLAVFAAQDDVMYLSYLAGVQGAISAILTLFPKECVDQWHAVCEGNIARARAINDRMLPVWRTIEGGAFPGRIKTALKLKGVAIGNARSPILKTDAATEARIAAALKENGFI